MRLTEIQQQFGLNLNKKLQTTRATINTRIDLLL